MCAAILILEKITRSYILFTQCIYYIYHRYMKTMINIKTDKDVKEEAQKIAREIGLPLSSVVNAYLNEFIRERAVRFAIEPQLRPEVGKFLRKASADYKRRKSIVGPFKTAQEMDAYLNA
jgi:addiction module RelB/DinJ family antitoxin